MRLSSFHLRSFSSLKHRIERIEDRVASSSHFGAVAVGALRTYRCGLSLLYTDARALASMKQPYTYQQLVLRSSTTRDLARAVPVVIFFVLPVVGNTLPVLTHFFPRLLPRALRSHKQTVTLALEAEKRQKETNIHVDRASDATKHFLVWSSFTPWMSHLIPNALKKIIGHNYARRLEQEDSLLSQHHDIIDKQLTTRQVQNALLARGKCLNIPASSVDSIPWFVANNGRDDPIPSALDDAALRAEFRDYIVQKKRD